MATRSAQRHGRVDAEDWAQWWDAVAQAEELAAWWEERERTDLGHQVDDLPTVDDYLQALIEGGCQGVGQVWQLGHDRIVGRR